MNKQIVLYNIYIYEKFNDLIKSNKNITNLNNNDLWKIFEYYSCIKLTEKYNKIFYEYDDINPKFKEDNKLSRYDSGIDLCDLTDTIVQCKLRNNTLNWNECSTFFGSQNIYCKEQYKTIIRWNNLIITRNKDSKLSKNLEYRLDLFNDIQYSKNKMIDYCNNLIQNPPIYPINNINFKLRDYQEECIELINNNNKNTIISLPTDTKKSHNSKRILSI